MRDSAKLLGGIAAIAFPVLLGWGYTAGASVAGDSDEGGGGTPHEVDTFELVSDEDGDFFTVDREETNGVVTLVVTDSDGNVVQPEAYADEVAELVKKVSSPDWVPDNTSDLFFIVDGRPCYDADALAARVDAEDGDVDAEGGDTHHGSLHSGEDGLFGIEVYADGTVDKGYIADPSLYSHEFLDAHRANGGRYLDLEGAQELNPC